VNHKHPVDEEYPMPARKRATIQAAGSFTVLLAVVFAASGSVTGQPPGRGDGAGDPATTADMEVS
jgi:hypothetical protein